MKGNLYDRMFHALEWMDEGKHPVEYLVNRFMPKHPDWERSFVVIETAKIVVEDYYANYF